MEISNNLKKLFLKTIKGYNQRLSEINATDFDYGEEHKKTVYEDEDCRIEEIVSYGSFTAAKIWYEQDEAELVYILQGVGGIELYGGAKEYLEEGESFFIPPFVRHRVSYTSPDYPCVWLCLFIKQKDEKVLEEYEEILEEYVEE